MRNGKKSCFVVMPIGNVGDGNYDHFKAVFEHIKQIVGACGYAVDRADDTRRPGAITKDIITKLVEFDLVIADLTCLNPNVFYELGIRHAFRGSGTIMILDENKTETIPFDLSAYRVLKYKGDLTGVRHLCNRLQEFVRTYDSEGEVSHKDNPVHDWYPMLPSNVLDAAAGATEAALRKEHAQLRELVSRYKTAFGELDTQETTETSPLGDVLAALADAKDGLLPTNILEGAVKAFEDKEVVAFLDKIRIIIEKNIKLPPSSFLVLISYADIFDLDSVAKALFKQALKFHPHNNNIIRRHLIKLAHSELPAERKYAEKELLRFLLIEITDNGVVFKDIKKTGQSLNMIGVLLDAYYRDGMMDEALTVIKKAMELFPDRTEIIRNYARAIEYVDKPQEALRYYRMAVLAKDADDTSAVWFGNELHNRDYNLAAAEVYAYACLLDPDDAHNFAHLADELSICLSISLRAIGSSIDVEGKFDLQHILNTVQCALSCSNCDAEAKERIRRVLKRVEIYNPKFDALLNRAERSDCILAIYERVKTDLTNDTVAEFDFSCL
ncbi:hypothetical protein [Desulfarculus baarsii]